VKKIYSRRPAGQHTKPNITSMNVILVWFGKERRSESLQCGAHSCRAVNATKIQESGLVYKMYKLLN
jgi:hypothetical protein